MHRGGTEVQAFVLLCVLVLVRVRCSIFDSVLGDCP